MKSEKNLCVLKSILKTQDIDYNELLDNILWMIHSQLELFSEFISKNSRKGLTEVKGINESVVKLAHLGRRVLNSECKQDVVILKDSFLLFTNLLYLSYYLTYASEELIRKDRKLAKEEEELILETKELYEGLVYSYRNDDIKGIQEFFQKRNDAFEKDISLLRNKNPDIVHFFLDFRKEMVAIGNFFLTMSFEKELKK